MHDIKGLDRTRKALLLTLGVMLLRLPVGMGIRLLFPNPEQDPALFYAGLMFQETLLWGVPALILLPFRSRRLAKEKRWMGISVGAAFLGILTQLLMMALTPGWIDLTGAEQSAVLLPENGIQWVLAILALVVVPALAEEAFFRGGLLTGLCERMSSLEAALAVSVVFALMHGSLAGFPAHLAVSLLCTLSMMATGRLRVPVMLHLCYNGAALLFRMFPVALIPVLPIALIILAAALALCAKVRWRLLRWPMPGDGALIAAILLGAATLYLPEILR